MKQVLLILMITLGLHHSSAQGIFDANIHTASPFGDVSSPAAESSQEIIDQDPQTKFLDFNNADGMGFEVDMLGIESIVNSIEIVTANDAPERDPNAYELFGSNDGMIYNLIVADDIPCVADRFLSRTFGFANTTAYSYYRINFTGNCAFSEITQVADVQLYPTIGNAPQIVCSEQLIVNNTEGLCGAIVDYEISAFDIEDGDLTASIVSGLESGSEFPIGISSVIYSVSDSDNNVVSCGFTVTVSDGEAPQLECPENLEIGLVNPDDTEVIVEFEVLYSDNCSVINPLEGYTSLGNINNKAYYLSEELFLAEDAFMEAELQGGFAGSILSEEDNQVILDWVKLNNNGVANILIGLNDVQYEGIFLWPNEEYADYTNWNENEPNNSGTGGGPENFVTMLTDGKWNDVDNTVARRYLLEIDFELIQTEGLASGSSFPVGTTKNSFVITDAAGNSSTCSFEVLVDASVNINELQTLPEVEIYPNPAKETFLINQKSEFLIEQCRIINLRGMIVKNIPIYNFRIPDQIDISRLHSGIYFIQMQTDQGLIIRRVIVL